jgi:hypothetical protein
MLFNGTKDLSLEAGAVLVAASLLLDTCTVSYDLLIESQPRTMFID